LIEDAGWRMVGWDVREREQGGEEEITVDFPPK